MSNKKSREIREIGMTKVGPAGEGGSNVWDDFRTEVVGIMISSSDRIHGLQFQYLENGVIINGERHGEFKGSSLTTVNFNPSEYLTGISGELHHSYTCYYGLKTSICALNFHTNLGGHQSIRSWLKGEKFSFNFGCDRFGGFHGKVSGKYVSAIGIYLKPQNIVRGLVKDVDNNRADNSGDEKLRQSDKGTKMADMGLIKIGPFPKVDDTHIWDDGRTEVVKIFMSYSTSKIDGIQFQYFEDGGLVLGDKHGVFSGEHFRTVTLNYPSEYLIGIKGFSCYSSSTTSSVASLSFQTNLGVHGPFGTKTGNSFCFEFGEERGRFGGFHGKINDKVSAIGVYLKPPPSKLRGTAEEVDSNEADSKSKMSEVD